MIELIPFYALCLYLLPFIVATARGHDLPVGVLVLTLLVGWTGIGWLAALGWAWAGGRDR